MAVLIEEIGPDWLAEYASIPMICQVRSKLVIDQNKGGLGGEGFHEESIRTPYDKDYDAYTDGGPLNWPRRFDLSTWGLWIARAAEDRGVVGGAAIARNVRATACGHPQEDPNDSAVLWDIRVRTSHRRQGIGTELFREAVRWTKSRGCRLLKIETQDVNVAACGFYAGMGCFLARIDPLTYCKCPDVASEVLLEWHFDLTRG